MLDGLLRAQLVRLGPRAVLLAVLHFHPAVARVHLAAHDRGVLGLHEALVVLRAEVGGRGGEGLGALLRGAVLVALDEAAAQHRGEHDVLVALLGAARDVANERALGNLGGQQDGGAGGDGRVLRGLGLRNGFLLKFLCDPLLQSRDPSHQSLVRCLQGEYLGGLHL